MASSSVTILLQLLETQRERLVLFRQFHEFAGDPYVRAALSFVIEDAQEAIAQAGSRLRQLGESSSTQPSTAGPEKILRQHQNERDIAENLRFVWRALVEQLAWYTAQSKSLRDDPDTQAILVALAEQNRVRLERWENLMDELKVSRNNDV